ncbi:MAG: hypothetical protein D6675_15125 [Gemmatimonadetes bacterium]|nr:MAG: hypothetical protein D6675_15125 [Gemmatimonadota bacterium]
MASTKFSDFLNAGLASAKNFDNEIALVHFSTAEDLLLREKETTETKANFVQLRLARGEILIQQSEWDNALQDFTKAYETAKELDDKEAMTNALIGQGKIKLQQGDLQTAKSLFQDALNTADAGKLEHKFPECQFHLGNTLSRLGENDKALMILESGVRIADRVNADPDIYAGINTQMGLLHFRMGMMDDAVGFYEKALEILQDEELSLRKAEAYRYLGVIYSIKRNYSKSLENYDKALEIYLDVENEWGMAKTYSSLGQAFKEMGNHHEAIFFYEKSQSLYEFLGAKSDMGMIYGKLGDVHIMLENYDAAIDYFQKDLAVSEELNNTHALSYTYRNLGKIYRLKKDYENSEKYFQRSYEFFSSVQDQMNTGRVFLDMAHLFLDMNQMEKALEHAQTAEMIFKQERKPRALAGVDVVMGKYHRQKREWDTAEAHFEKALDALDEGKLSEDLASAHYEYGLMCMEKRDDSKAINHFNRALEISEDLGLNRMIEECLHCIEKIDEREVIRIALRRLKSRELTNTLLKQVGQGS